MCSKAGTGKINQQEQGTKEIILPNQEALVCSVSSVSLPGGSSNVDKCSEKAILNVRATSSREVNSVALVISRDFIEESGSREFEADIA